MRDLTTAKPGALCFDSTGSERPRLRLRRQGDPEGEVIISDGLIACPRWINPTFDALAECAEAGRDLACLRGNRIGALIRAHQRTDGRDLRRRQFRRHDEPSATLRLAISLVVAKTAGQLSILRRAALQRGDAELDAKADRIARDRQGLPVSTGFDALRGREGIIARTYFGAWPRMLALPGFQRIPRRAANPINLLLDLCYSRLCLTVTLALLDQGLDLGLGTLHSDDDRRPTLALDLMEPLRPLIADRFILNTYRQAMAGGWFSTGDGGGWNLTRLGRGRWRQKWDTWFHGGSRRVGQRQAVDQAIAAYRGWIDGEESLSWPGIDR